VRTSIAPRIRRQRQIRTELRGLERAARAAGGGFARIQLYWEMGRRVVEGELEAPPLGRRATRAARPPSRAGAAFLRQVRSFYIAFPKRGLLRRELDWTHYRALCRLDNVIARHALMNEAAVRRWPARELARRVRELGGSVKRDVSRT
jgi:hypothetical protein